MPTAVVTAVVMAVVTAVPTAVVTAVVMAVVMAVATAVVMAVVMAVAMAVATAVVMVSMARARTAVASARRGRGEDRALLRGLCPRMTPAAPGLSIPLRFIPASAVALRRERVQSNRNEEGCRLCPPEPMDAHGHVNGWREEEGFGGHSLSLTDIAIATGVPAKHTTGHTSAGTRSFRRLK